MTSTELSETTPSPGTDAAVAMRRFVNDEIAKVGGRFDDPPGRYEFLCECGDLACDGRVELTLAEYQASTPGSVLVH